MFLKILILMLLHIYSWGSGANPWGPDKDDRFSTPNHYDGLLEIVGVTGVVHLGQIQSGIRYANRIAQVIKYYFLNYYHRFLTPRIYLTCLETFNKNKFQRQKNDINVKSI